MFGARFEDNADLQVEFLDLQGQRLTSLLQTVNNDSVYKVRISNIGEAVAHNIRIREFVPKAGGQLTPTMVQAQASCVIDGSGGDCEAADGTLRQDVPTLAPGASLTYTLTRRVNGTAAVPADTGALTSVAAFVDPTQNAEANPRDNSRSLRIGLIVNGAPTATAQTVATPEDSAVNITLAGIDPEGLALTYSVGAATHGVVSGVAPNVVFTPAADYNGAASFTFTVTDINGVTSAPATVTINVAAVNDAPRVVAALADVTYAEGGFVDLSTASAFADPEGASLNYTVSGKPASLNFSPSSGLLIGTLSQTDSGSYNITITATEVGVPANFVSDTFVLTVSNTNQNPTVASALADRTDAEGASVSTDIAANFTDADAGDTLTFAVSSGTLPPGITLSPAGLLSGTLTAVAANGSPYTITINANDGEGGSVSDTFEWTVTAQNFAPQAVGTLANQTYDAGETVEIEGATVRAAFTDPDGDVLTYSAQGLPAGLTMFGSSTIAGTLTAPAGVYPVTITAKDAALLEVVQQFTITVE